MVEDRLFPGCRIGHVQFVPRHVEVAADDQRRLGREVLPQEGPQPPQPVELVGVLGRADDLAVGHVGADDLDFADMGRDEPRLRVFGTITNALADVLRFDPAEDAHAIERLLAEDCRAVACLADFIKGKRSLRFNSWRQTMSG